MWESRRWVLERGHSRWGFLWGGWRRPKLAVRVAEFWTRRGRWLARFKRWAYALCPGAPVTRANSPYSPPLPPFAPTSPVLCVLSPERGVVPWLPHRAGRSPCPPWAALPPPCASPSFPAKTAKGQRVGNLEIVNCRRVRSEWISRKRKCFEHSTSPPRDDHYSCLV